MYLVGIILRIAGSLCLFIFGMKMMSDGVQKSAGDRLRQTLNFMTKNRFLGVLTGFLVTVILQSSTTTTLLIVSFANAGLLSLTQSIGVIMGANVGTTLTAWIVSFVGFSLRMSDLAIPAIGIGFVMRASNWKGKNLGGFILGFGLLFLGLQYLTTEMRDINELVHFETLGVFMYGGFVTVLASAAAGIVMAALMNSSSAATVVILTMAYSGVISFEMSAAMVLGSNLGTTISMPLAAIGANTAAKRAALVHILFNAAGFLWALPLLTPLLALVAMLVPVDAVGAGATMHLAMLHTVYNVINVIVFLPFVTPFTKLVSRMVKDDDSKQPKQAKGPYVFSTFSNSKGGATELNILRAEKEIRDMAGMAASMYSNFTAFLRSLRDTVDKEGAAKLCDDLKLQEEYVDEMRGTLSDYLIQCTKGQINPKTEERVFHLLRVISDIEEMTDECYNISRLLEKNVRKDRIFKREELEDLIPYVNMVEEILGILKENLGHAPTQGLSDYIAELEKNIKKSRKKLKKLSRKRIEAGKDVRTELAFIDLVQRIEKLGEYCVGITEKIRV
ncbi:MAG: Na/Pi cotransporter family protein [Spirochaetes bacterium]|nr:Na/Pi cotransporter family protein [Spirochaetota bacterium]